MSVMSTPRGPGSGKGASEKQGFFPVCEPALSLSVNSIPSFNLNKHLFLFVFLRKKVYSILKFLF